MNESDVEFLNRLLATFRIEAKEHLQGISAGLLELEKAELPEVRAGLLERVFREAHSLKGAARAVNLGAIETLCQALEGVFSALKKEEAKPSAALFDLLQRALDVLAQMLAEGGSERLSQDKALHRELVSRLDAASRGEAIRAEPRQEQDGTAPVAAAEGGCGGDAAPEEHAAASLVPVAPLPGAGAPPVTAETVRVSTERLSSVLLQAEEMLSAKLAAGQRASELRAAHAAFALWRKEWGRMLPLIQELRPALKASGRGGEPGGSAELPGSLGKVLDFLDWNADFVKALETRYAAEAKSAERDGRILGGMVNNLLEEMKKVLMFPFSSLLEILPKIVRDLSRDSGKEVDLAIRGEEIEIDRRILEGMKDPLVHLVRNCIDHGIEKPEEREGKQKPRRGTITVEVSPRDNNVELVVADDGVGISLARIRSALLKLGAVARERVEELTDQELLPYVFQSGVSTSPIITELSGRGLGLAIVREKVEKLGGTVAIDTRPDRGTTFRIILPLTVATFRGILVRVGERVFAIPGMHVERAVRLDREAIRTVENRETIRLNGEPLSLVRLADVLGLPRAAGAAEASGLPQSVILNVSGTRIAFLVDEVAGEQEVLLKNLGPQLSRVRNVAGATVLGSGRVVPILNVPDLLKSAVQRAGAAPGIQSASEAAAPAQKRSVLVAEDSITTRTLLKNILETAGYDVVTAVDGLDALTRLKSGAFDIVVSDVDMPRMSGFELTARIRADKGLEELPVVLVTALESREDRERGIDSGASAYIVKGSFEQSNLLEVMKKLI